jgi:hypothetical protein
MTIHKPITHVAETRSIVPDWRSHHAATHHPIDATLAAIPAAVAASTTPTITSDFLDAAGGERTAASERALTAGVV